MESVQKLKSEISELEAQIEKLIDTVDFSGDENDKSYWELQSLYEDLDNKQASLLEIENIPIELISASISDKVELEKVILGLTALKDNFAKWGEGQGDETFIWEIVRQLRIYGNYLQSDWYSEQYGDLPNSYQHFARAEEETLSLIEEKYSFWIKDEEGNPGILLKRLNELNT